MTKESPGQPARRQVYKSGRARRTCSGVLQLADDSVLVLGNLDVDLVDVLLLSNVHASNPDLGQRDLSLVELDATSLLHLLDERLWSVDSVVASEVVPSDVLGRVDAFSLDGLLQSQRKEVRVESEWCAKRGSDEP